MISTAVRPCTSKFNEASKPVLVTDGKLWWVEDPPNRARMLPADSEQAAEEIWDKVIAASRPRPRPVPTLQKADDCASARH